MVVGGAAVAFGGAPQITHGVDVVSEGVAQDFRNAVAAVGRREGLDAHWLALGKDASGGSSGGSEVSRVG